MFIENIDYENKEILVAIPLTTTSGKIRVKQRDNIYGYGTPFATRKNRFNLRNYIEWQIGYDIDIKSEKKNLTTIKHITFKGFNGKTKYLYELSEYLYYLVKFKVISLGELEKTQNFIESLDENSLIDRHPHCLIKRTHPHEEIINRVNFEILKVEYPQLIHRFKNYEIITEITIREKQRAIGIQPMLYFCFPITELISKEPLIGRTAKTKEFAYFKFNRENSFIVLEMIKIFGILSKAHQFDIIQIIEKIKNDSSLWKT